jgi:hypothetical protein
MIRIYYHIYLIDGVETIVDEQLNLITKHFNFPYTLNIGVSIGKQDETTSHIIDKLKPNLRDIRAFGNEFTTLDLIEKDKENFGDTDYILYIHTKGVTHMNKAGYNNIISWRHFMNYFNIERHKDVFKLFERTNFNTYGVLMLKDGNREIYSGNFWWAKALYLKTIKMDGVKKNRFNAEVDYIQNGVDWKPYSSYNREGETHYSILFKREEYAK